MASREKGENMLMVAAIDFGTTYSGYAYGMRHELEEDPPQLFCPHWQGRGSIISFKAPTTVLLDENKEFVAFGYDAEDQYADLAEEEKHEDHFYFYRFKMMLYEKVRRGRLTMNTTVPDILNREVPAVEIFTHAIHYLKEHLLKDVKQRAAHEVEETDILWLVTVPAIWDDPAKQFMRQAAEKAGIDRDKLRIALEPEAASIWCKHLPVEKLKGSDNRIDSFQVGSKYLVLDAGGGTVDITIHEVKDGGKIRELAKASGGDWGGINVDNAFKAALVHIVGETLMEEFRHECTADYIELFRDFEIKKRKTNESNDVFVTLKIPLSFVDMCGNLKGMISSSKYNGEIRLESDKLRISRSTFDGFFKPTCDKVVDHVRELLGSQRARGVDFILMVGGFSESQVLQDAIKGAFCSNYRVIIPQEAGLAVLKGAVLFGKNPTIIDCRIAQRTYGIASSTTFNPEIHREAKKFRVNGVDKCDGLFSRHVKKNDELKLNVAQAEKTYTPLKSNQTSMRISLYKSENDNPMYIDDPGCKYLGSYDVDMQDTTGGLDRKVKVSLLFGDTEIEVQSLVVRTGDKTSRQFEFLEDEP
ncbi:heat shock 70 kDa protein 12A-like [Saccostrea cucullata]|uniref:heat shock 70 kDa protein 12A-like n=1 Tax=Saccostrea cuccullata TaxID=36930 RepID=UPI002ED27726